jgi:hypothetical protein
MLTGGTTFYSNTGLVTIRFQANHENNLAGLVRKCSMRRALVYMRAYKYLGDCGVIERDEEFNRDVVLPSILNILPILENTTP